MVGWAGFACGLADHLSALRLFAQKQIAEAPVVNPDNPRRVIGMISREEVIAAYDQQMQTHNARRRR